METNGFYLTKSEDNEFDKEIYEGYLRMCAKEDFEENSEKDFEENFEEDLGENSEEDSGEEDIDEYIKKHSK